MTTPATLTGVNFPGHIRAPESRRLQLAIRGQSVPFNLHPRLGRESAGRNLFSRAFTWPRQWLDAAGPLIGMLREGVQNQAARDSLCMPKRAPATNSIKVLRSSYLPIWQFGPSMGTVAWSPERLRRRQLIIRDQDTNKG